MAALSALAWLCVLGPACAPTRPVDGPVTQSPAPVVVTTTDAPLMPLRAASGAFVVTLGNDKGQTLDYTVTRQDDGTWRAALEGKRASVLRVDDAGNVLLLREEECDENVLVEYDPALLLVPAQPGGDVAEQTAKMTVRHRDSGAVRDTGSVTSRLSYTGAKRVSTPAGEFDAFMLRNSRVIDLPLADVDVTIDTAYAPGVGPVAERVHRRTRALGLFGGVVEQEIRRAR